MTETRKKTFNDESKTEALLASARSPAGNDAETCVLSTAVSSSDQNIISVGVSNLIVGDFDICNVDRDDSSGISANASIDSHSRDADDGCFGYNSGSDASSCSATNFKKATTHHFLYLLTCSVPILLSFLLGILTPSFLSLQIPVAVPKEGFSNPLGLLDALQRNPQRRSQEPTLLPRARLLAMNPTDAVLHTTKLPCNDEHLSKVLHDIQVPGLHVICLNKNIKPARPAYDMPSENGNDYLQVTVYPQAQKSNSPLSLKILLQKNTGSVSPTWYDLRAALMASLRLRETDGIHQPWSIFTIDGQERIVDAADREDEIGTCGQSSDETVANGIIGRLLKAETVLLYEGGQFFWPGVRVGFQRTININSDDDMKLNNSDDFMTLETLSLRPLVFSVKGFLTHTECDIIQSLAEPSMKYSDVVLMDKDKGRPAKDFRTSQSTFLSSADHADLIHIDDRMEKLVRIPKSHQETLQVLRYGYSEKYDPHHDYFDPKLYMNDQRTLQLIKYGRHNRMATVFWYLSDVEKGGETHFPRSLEYMGNHENAASHASAGIRPSDFCVSNSAADLASTSSTPYSNASRGLKVKPEKGKVIIFYNIRPDGELDPLSLHGACPVEKGVKWAANKWIWNSPVGF